MELFDDYLTSKDRADEKEIEKDFLLMLNYNRRVIRELRYFQKEMGHADSLEGITIKQPGCDVLHWDAFITGPENTPYEGGIFELNVIFPFSYPKDPPRIMFKTPIYHPNVSDAGSICFSPLKTEIWQQGQYSVAVVLVGIRMLLVEPTADDPLNYEAGVLYGKDREAFNRKAREYTAKFAANK